jgi:hypothetical protein
MLLICVGGGVLISKLTDNFKKILKTLKYYWLVGGNTSNPSQTLKTLDTIEIGYSKALLELGLQDNNYWQNYTRGRAYYRLNNYKASTKSLNIVLAHRANFGLKVKS